MASARYNRSQRDSSAFERLLSLTVFLVLGHMVAGQAPTRGQSKTTTPPRNRPYVVPGLIEDAPMYRAQD